MCLFTRLLHLWRGLGQECLFIFSHISRYVLSVQLPAYDAAPPGHPSMPSVLEFAAAWRGPGSQPDGQKAHLHLASSAPSVMRKGPRHHCPKKPSLETIWLIAGHGQTSSGLSRVFLPGISTHQQSSTGFLRNWRDLEPFPHTSCPLWDWPVPRDADRTSSASGPPRQAAADSQGMAAPRASHDLLGQKSLWAVRSGKNRIGGRRVS